MAKPARRSESGRGSVVLESAERNAFRLVMFVFASRQCLLRK